MDSRRRCLDPKKQQSRCSSHGGTASSQTGHQGEQLSDKKWKSCTFSDPRLQRACDPCTIRALQDSARGPGGPSVCSGLWRDGHATCRLRGAGSLQGVWCRQRVCIHVCRSVVRDTLCTRQGVNYISREASPMIQARMGCDIPRPEMLGSTCLHAAVFTLRIVWLLKPYRARINHATCI